MKDAEQLFQGVLPFVEVARSRSFGQAAATLGISTPAVSKAVSRLEQRLGVRLLLRTSRTVELTPEGERYLSRCQEAVASMEAAREQMNASKRAPSGDLAINLSPILAPQLVPALPRFAARYPRVTLRVSLSDRVSKLHEERVDVALRVGVRTDSSLIQKRLLVTRWVTVASPAFLARHEPPRVPADLLRLNCLRFVLPNGKPRDFTYQAPGVAEPEEVAVRGNLVIDQGVQLLEAALAGMGVAQVLDFMTHQLLRGGALTEVLAPFSAPGPAVYAVATPERHRSPNVRAFNAFLSELF